MLYWAASCLLIALVARSAGYPDFAQDMACNGMILAGVGAVLAIASFLVRRGRES